VPNYHSSNPKSLNFVINLKAKKPHGGLSGLNVGIKNKANDRGRDQSVALRRNRTGGVNFGSLADILRVKCPLGP
jgi:hypothetical protein